VPCHSKLLAYGLDGLQPLQTVRNLGEHSFRRLGPGEYGEGSSAELSLGSSIAQTSKLG
jgi:hypothetical protein